jgi:hypothetical protein
MMRFAKYIFIRFIVEKITINITIKVEVEWYDGSNRRIGQVLLELTHHYDVAAVVPEDDVQTPAIQGHETPLIEQAPEPEEAQWRKDHGCTTDSARPVLGEAQAI